MKTKLLIMSIILTASINQAWADIPQQCPSLSIIKATNLEILVDQRPGQDFWYIDLILNFGTKFPWEFRLDKIYANSNADAKDKAFNIIRTASIDDHQKPVQSTSNPDEWVCVYKAVGYSMTTTTSTQLS